MKIITAFVCLVAVVLAAAPSPKAEIEALLAYVQNLEGAKFIRNGSEHEAGQAVAHLRLKWEKQDKEITSAEDFIALCASKSSLSGERYRIRFKNGSERFCDELLREQLAALRRQGH